MRRKHKGKSTGSSQGYWQSYSDMMAALLLMFVLIMAFTLAQSLTRFEEKESQLAAERAKVEEQELQLAKAELELAEKERETEEQQEVLDKQQRQIDELIGVKAEIIEKLRDTFEDSHLKVEIDEGTGAIALDSSVLFAYNSKTLSYEGIGFLREFLPLYFSVLLSEECRPYISEIIIEGHTDTTGEYLYNLNLSQGRAFAVAAFCLDEDRNVFEKEQVEQLRGIMTANGRSFSNPIYNEDGTVDADKSRRVEIKFRVHDEKMIEQLQEILDGALE